MTWRRASVDLKAKPGEVEVHTYHTLEGTSSKVLTTKKYHFETFIEPNYLCHASFKWSKYFIHTMVNSARIIIIITMIIVIVITMIINS